MDIALAIVSITGALSLLFLGHFFVYKSTVRLFAIKGNMGKKLTAAIYPALSLSYIAATIQAHFADNSFTRTSYFLTGLWFGSFINLIMAFAVAWALFYFFQKALGPKIKPKIFGFLALTATLFVSGYGVWNAYHPRINNVNIQIKGLPENWKGKRIVHISDVHLGQFNGASFLAKNVATINALKPEAVFITGDLFDGTDGYLSEMALPLNDLTTPKGLYSVTGNHENILGDKKVKEAFKNIDIRLLNDESVDVAGLQVIGLSYPKNGTEKNIRETVEKLKVDGAPSILLFHSPYDIEVTKASGIALQLSGHTHKGQLFPIGYLTGITFRGYDYGLKKAGDLVQYTTSGLGVWGAPMRLGNRPEIVVITLF